MLFNSVEYIFIFLPIVFFIYYYLNAKRLLNASKAFLVFASLFFYSWWNVAYLPLILISMLFNYTIGNSFSKNKKISNKSILIFSVIANLSLLGYFKYADFFIENINLVSNNNIDLLHLALPLAISFFTFQQIAYLVDSYRGETKEYDFLNYAIFVTFFPQLIAGPIVHHKEMMPQFANTRNKVKNYKNIATGLFIFSIGLFKKVIIADHFAKVANIGYQNTEILNILEAWATSLSYTFQLYFDFSGYTDMAIGAALLFNIKLPINFNSPYKALSIQDFWRRWHMTLSRFLKDYIYIPLGGNRKGNLKTYNNLMATFILGGLWHGAGWTFIFWGFLHGVALIIHRVWNILGFKMNKIIAWFITFNFINITWVFFRADNFTSAINLIKNMFLGSIMFPDRYIEYFQHQNISFGHVFGEINGGNSTTIYILLFIILIWTKNSNELALAAKTSFKAILLSIAFTMSTLHLSGYSEFLYFRF